MFTTPVLVAALVSSSVLAAPPDADEPAEEGRILIWKEGKHVLLSPARKALEELAENRKQFRLLKPDGKTVAIPVPEKSKLTDPSISPDGKRVAFIGDYAWSPDSRRVAYVWKRMEPGVPLASGLDKDGKPKEGKAVDTETHLNVADPNGKNTKTILSAKGRAGPAISLKELEWR